MSTPRYEELDLVELLQAKPRPYHNLALHQLVHLHDKKPGARAAVRDEWQRRSALDFPYFLAANGAIIDERKNARVSDEHAPMNIIEQRDRWREQRQEKGVGG